MSVLLLYALVDADAELTPLPAGLGGRRPRKVACGRLAGIVSDHEGPPTAEVDSLWDYERLLEQVIKQTAMLPLRYGTTFADERALSAAVAAREGPLRAALERVRGAVEIAVRAPAEHRQPAGSDGVLDEAPSSPGRAYMLERLAARQRGRSLELELERAMDGLVRAWAPRGEGAHALLVEHAHVGEVARRARTLGLIASGPWPPFSFTGEASAAGERWASAAGERWASAVGERWASAAGSRT